MYKRQVGDRVGSVGEVDDFLQDRVGDGDHPGAGLKAALGGDHVGKLAGEIHIGLFERAGLNAAEPVRVGGIVGAAQGGACLLYTSRCV